MSKRYFGIDLAWGQRSRTGIAVLDESGKLVESASVVTDAQIAAFIARHRADVEIAAIDAPLIVTNPTGRRTCEAELTALFGRFHAGVYPANLANPLFVPPRGRTLSEAHGWPIDPRATGSVALEVYPHSAMVALFGLDRVIPYKAKPGRDFPSLQSAFLTLLGHVERVCGELLALAASTRWQELRDAVGTASRKADLAQIEDEVDGIFCAYIAWMWRNTRSALTVVGTPTEGFIVTPPPPSDRSLRVEQDGQVLRVWLNRPDKHNALDDDVLTALTEVYAGLQKRFEVKVVVLGGRGPSFCAGADRRTPPGQGGGGAREARWNAQLGLRAVQAIADCEAVTIARLHGNVIGGGVALATACDFRIAADETRLRVPEVQLGVPLTWGTIPRLISEVGAARARELTILGDWFDAAYAERIGLVHRTAPYDALDETVDAMVDTVLGTPELALHFSKTQFRAYAAASRLGDATDTDGDSFNLAMASEDALRNFGRRS